MSEPRIGRLVVAALHQAIAEALPLRIEFYENWLKPLGLLEQGRQIGAASFSAALSFLRREDPPSLYDQITGRAGTLAAEWSYEALPWASRTWPRMLPAGLRARRAVAHARVIARTAYPGSRLSARLQRGSGQLEVRGSIFCVVRESVDAPLCGFYAGLLERLIAYQGLVGRVTVRRCRASGGQSCELDVAWHADAAQERHA